MNDTTQSGWIAAALIGGFVLYIFAAGKAQAYWSILVGGSSASSAATPAAQQNYLIPPNPAIGFPGVTGLLPDLSFLTNPSPQAQAQSFLPGGGYFNLPKLLGLGG